MAPRLKPTLSKAHKEGIRKAALARHAARKAAGLLSPAGLPYVKAPDPATPKPVEPPVATKPVEEVRVPSPAPYSIPPIPMPPAPPQPPSARDLFLAWLRSPKGQSACDTRMSSDPVRFGAELEDRAFVAWQAGYEEGRDG